MAGNPNGEDLSCLDVGCASGYLSFDLALRGWKVTAIDPFLPSELDAQDKEVEFRKLGILEFNATPFNLVIAGDVLEHIEDGRAVMNKLYELVIAQGHLLISVPNAVNLYARQHILFGKFDYKDRGPFDRTHVRFYTLKTLVELIESSGFTILEKRYTPFPAYMLLEGYSKSLNSVTMKALTLLAKYFPRLFAYQFVFKLYKIS